MKDVRAAQRSAAPATGPEDGHLRQGERARGPAAPGSGRWLPQGGRQGQPLPAAGRGRGCAAPGRPVAGQQSRTGGGAAGALSAEGVGCQVGPECRCRPGAIRRALKPGR